MVQIQSNDVQKPSAHITVNRNRVKTYDQNVYLKDETSFEIELWNPTKSNVLASISIDGKLISENGIIIRPGERVYLERWIDKPQKLKFSTYEVENSLENKEAIENNGKITVAFHSEVYKNQLYTGNPYRPYDPYYCGPYQTTLVYNSSYLINNTNLYSSNISLETGRTEEGEKSSQNFISNSGDFNTFPSHIISWKILPESLKPVDIQQVRSYCTECGTRIRAASWKFCPLCGTKF